MLSLKLLNLWRSLKCYITTDKCELYKELTEAEVRIIENIFNLRPSIPIELIAKDFNVSYGTILKIYNRTHQHSMKEM